MKECTCGYANVDEAKFCKMCGKKLEVETTVDVVSEDSATIMFVKKVNLSDQIEAIKKDIEKIQDKLEKLEEDVLEQTDLEKSEEIDSLNESVKILETEKAELLETITVLREKAENSKPAKRCSECEAIFESDALYCPMCGKKLEDVRIDVSFIDRTVMLTGGNPSEV